MLQVDLYIFPKMRSYKCLQCKICLKNGMFIICLADKTSYLKQYGPTSRSCLFRSDSIHGGPLQKFLAHIFVRDGGDGPFPSNPRFNTEIMMNITFLFMA